MDRARTDRQAELRAFIKGRRDRMHFQVDLPGPAPGAVPADLDRPKGAIIRDGSLQLRRQLWEIDRRATMDTGDDWVPALFPYMGTGLLASAFGAETRFPDDEDPWTRPLVHSAAEALKLVRPSADAYLLGETLERTRRMRQAAPDLPIRQGDIQSPLDTAMLLWEQADLFTSMVLAPKAVHHVLGLVTEVTIEFVRRQQDAAAGGDGFVPLHWPAVWWPDGAGLGVSDDILPLIGPDQYREFALPYLARLSEAFGGLMLHSCGHFRQNLELVAGIPGLRMLNFGATEQPVAEASAAMPPEVIISTHIGLNTDPHFGTSLAFAAHAVGAVDDSRRLWLLAGSDGPTSDDYARTVAAIRRLAKEASLEEELAP